MKFLLACLVVMAFGVLIAFTPPVVIIIAVAASTALAVRNRNYR